MNTKNQILQNLNPTKNYKEEFTNLQYNFESEIKKLAEKLEITKLKEFQQTWKSSAGELEPKIADVLEEISLEKQRKMNVREKNREVVQERFNKILKEKTKFVNEKISVNFQNFKLYDVQQLIQETQKETILEMKAEILQYMTDEFWLEEWESIMGNKIDQCLEFEYAAYYYLSADYDSYLICDKSATYIWASHNMTVNKTFLNLIYFNLIF